MCAFFRQGGWFLQDKSSASDTKSIFSTEIYLPLSDSSGDVCQRGECEIWWRESQQQKLSLWEIPIGGQQRQKPATALLLLCATVG